MPYWCCFWAIVVGQRWFDQDGEQCWCTQKGFFFELQCVGSGLIFQRQKTGGKDERIWRGKGVVQRCDLMSFWVPYRDPNVSPNVRWWAVGVDPITARGVQLSPKRKARYLGSMTPFSGEGEPGSLGDFDESTVSFNKIRLEPEACAVGIRKHIL